MSYAGVRIQETDINYIMQRVGLREDGGIAAVVRLRWCNGLPYTAIAAELGIKPTAAKMRMSRFRQRFKAMQWQWQEQQFVAEFLKSAQDAEEAIHAALSAYDQAGVILETVRGPRDADPPKPEFDEHDNPIAGAPRMITREELATYIAQRDHKRRKGVA